MSLSRYAISPLLAALLTALLAAPVALSCGGEAEITLFNAEDLLSESRTEEEDGDALDADGGGEFVPVEGEETLEEGTDPAIPVGEEEDEPDPDDLTEFQDPGTIGDDPAEEDDPQGDVDTGEDAPLPGEDEEDDVLDDDEVDAGHADAGHDAGHADAGQSDAGHADAGHADAGQADAGHADAGSGGSTDAGTTPSKYVTLDKHSIALPRSATTTITAKVKPSNTTITWTVKNITEGDDSAVSSIAEVTKGEKTIKLKAIAAGARLLQVTAKGSNGQSDTAKVYVKPYTKPKATATSSKPKLSCKYFGTATTKVFNRDLYKKYVQPAMQTRKVDGKTSYYGTRASVVAAARFLVLQFPYSFPYYMEKRSGGITTYPTNSHYNWTSGTLASDASDVRVFGLNLNGKAYNSYASDKAIKSDVTPWACGLSSGSQNGLECSGFVNWSLRNGRFYLGDWKTHLFAADGSCVKNGKTVKNYLCETFVYNTKGQHNFRSNRNNKLDGAMSKLDALVSSGNSTDGSSDFKKIGSMSDKNQKVIKAGDILWHGKYTKADGTSGSGHVGMIIGLERNSDGTIKRVHTGEAAEGYGNLYHVYTWDYFQKCSKWAPTTCNGAGTVNGSRLYNSYVVSMRHVYDYYSDKYGFSTKGSEYKYTDMW